MKDGIWIVCGNIKNYERVISLNDPPYEDMDIMVKY